MKIRKQIRILGVFWARESITVIILLVYFLILAFLNPIFFKIRNLIGIGFAASMEIPAVIGMQSLLATGNFDLSIGSVAALSGMVSGLLLIYTRNVLFSIVVGLSTGVLFGLLNGSLVTKVKINALVVTLATMGIARAITLGIVRGRTIRGFPPSFALMGQGIIYSVPVCILISVVMIIIASFSFRKIRYCRRFYYVGSNEQAATYCGIKVPQVIRAAFMFTGVASAFTGIILISRTMSSSPLVFQNLPLEAIAACVIGGSSIKGGEGSVIGAIMGLFIIIITRNIMLLLNVSVYWKELVIGAILITAVAADAYITSKEVLLSRGTEGTSKKRKSCNKEVKK